METLVTHVGGAQHVGHNLHANWPEHVYVHELIVDHAIVDPLVEHTIHGAHDHKNHKHDRDLKFVCEHWLFGLGRLLVCCLEQGVGHCHQCLALGDADAPRARKATSRCRSRDNKGYVYTVIYEL